LSGRPEELTWNGAPDPIIECGELFEDTLGWTPAFRCPRHLAAGALQVLAGEYEPGIPQLTEAWPPRVLDIGANVGAFGLWVRHKWPGARVDSYEPNPRAFAVLHENWDREPFHWRIHARGVAALAGRARLHEGKGNLGEASIHADVGGSKPDEGVDVELEDAAELPDAEVVKVDTEGCEVEILDRYLQTHRVAPTLVMLEYHRAIDRLLLEELLGWHGLALMRGMMLSPVRGTQIFARTREHPTQARVTGDLQELRRRVAPLAELATPAKT
jgi:FkbM family methyltransferase